MKIGDYIQLIDYSGMPGCFKIIDIAGDYIILHYIDKLNIESEWFYGNKPGYIAFKKSQLEGIKTSENIDTYKYEENGY